MAVNSLYAPYETFSVVQQAVLPYTEGKTLGSSMPLTVNYSVSETEQFPTQTTKKLDGLYARLYPYDDGVLLSETVNVSTANGVLVGRNTDVVKLPTFGDTTGEVVGFLDNLKKTVNLTTWATGANTFLVNSASVQSTRTLISEVAFRTPVAPLKPSNFQFLCELSDGTKLNLTFDEQGVLNTQYAEGRIDYTSGFVFIAFRTEIDLTNKVKTVTYEKASTGDTYSRPIYTYWTTADAGQYYAGSKTYISNGKLYAKSPLGAKVDSMKYNAVAFTYLPLDKDLIGVDTVKLPQSGLVPSYRKGDLILVKAEKSIDYPELTASTLYSVGLSRLTLIELVDSLGAKLAYSGYEVDLDAGTFTTKSTFDTSSYQAPFKAVYRYQDMAVATDVQISGDITLSKPLTHDFSPEDTLVSNAIVIGTMQARVSNLFTQQNWNSKFLDYREGNDTIFKYDTALTPIEVTDADSIQERWAIVFVNSTNFELIGENIGKVASGTTLEDFMPLNPVTKKPYFIMRKNGFSNGATTGNVLRFNTSGANYPVWVVRTVLQSDSQIIDHKFSLEFKGNKDRVL